MTFLFPLGLIGLGALGGVLLLYLYQQRFRPAATSALFLWDGGRSSREGGRSRQPLRWSRCLCLDLLAVACLALAAAEPVVELERGRPWFLVLDASLSMQGRDEGATALAKARAVLVRDGREPIGLVFAGQAPQVLTGLTVGQAEEALREYAPYHTGDSVAESVALVRELASGTPEIHVLTDQTGAPPVPPRASVVLHRLAGRASNLCLAGLRRSRDELASREVLRFGVANFTDETQAVEVVVTAASGVVHRETLALESGATRGRELPLPARSGPLTVRLDGAGDALSADSAGRLLPPPVRPVRFRVDVAERSLQVAWAQVLRAAGARVVRSTPDLLVTDGAEGEGRVCTVRLAALGEAGPVYVGPYVVDGVHPLAEQLDLRGVYWGTPPVGQIAPQPTSVVAAGDVPLIWEARGGAEFRMRLVPARSNLFRHQAWPVLGGNLVRLVRRRLPGLERSNLQPGEALGGHGQGPWRVEDLAGRDMGRGGRAPWRPGRYRVRGPGGESTEIQVNAWSLAESDLRGLSAEAGTVALGSGEAGASIHAWTYLGWLGVVLGCGLLVLNWMLLRRSAVGQP